MHQFSYYALLRPRFVNNNEDDDDNDNDNKDNNDDDGDNDKTCILRGYYNS